MTVEVQTPFHAYTAAPGATVFTYKFKIIASVDLIATINGGAPLELGVHYALTGVGCNDGGDLTLFAPLVGGEAVLLKRQMTFNRKTDYQQNGDFNAPVINNDFDRLWIALQQLDQNLLRTLKLPFSETIDQTLALSATQRAQKALVFDANGKLSVGTDHYKDMASTAARFADTSAASAAASATSAKASGSYVHDALRHANTASSYASAASNSAKAAANSAKAAAAAVVGSNGLGNRTISSSAPSGGANGDIWYQV